MTRCRAAAATRLSVKMLSEYLLSNHAGAYHLFVVNEADAKGIFQFR